MSSTIDIAWWQLAIFSSVLIIPLLVSRIYQLGIGKEIIISVGRMTLQLLLVGMYLEYLFKLNSIWINLVWLTLMILVGASSIVSKTHLPRKKLLLPITFGLAAGLFPIVTILCLGIVHPSPWYSAQYLIPLAGMLLGNSLSGNIVALQNLFTAFEERKNEYEAAISLGASPQYASRDFVRNALRKANAPLLASMATIGLVTLPGMMTGQILGGATPLIAIKYQLMIMIAIFVMMTISLTLSIHLTLKATFTKEGRINVTFRD
ncbi:ABC transporter permease [Vibrio ziniensis]|uniref:ABC transporter permease n=1 Tax=Vibrio ziniensis TaxID=2711221 RepID=A0A6G7CJ22_9VIBR|nr:ABC transporter permease [Vibrio ziniensis]QIH42048.1 ABC transporter permease [Vibrio ziniensis]